MSHIRKTEDMEALMQIVATISEQGDKAAGNLSEELEIFRNARRTEEE
jgi:hypothetical protein